MKKKKMIEISQPINEEMIKEGRDNTKQRIKDNPSLNTRYKIGELKNALTYYPDTELIFNYSEKLGALHINLWIDGINMVLNTSVQLSPHDKISILNFINKDNNRIKSQIEEMEHMLKQDVKTCRFCDSTDIEKFMPRGEDTAINLCPQHQKYIQRVSERINGKQDLV